VDLSLTLWLLLTLQVNILHSRGVILFYFILVQMFFLFSSLYFLVINILAEYLVFEYFISFVQPQMEILGIQILYTILILLAG
jgi:hypothetical protein